MEVTVKNYLEFLKLVRFIELWRQRLGKKSIKFLATKYTNPRPLYHIPIEEARNYSEASFNR